MRDRRLRAGIGSVRGHCMRPRRSSRGGAQGQDPEVTELDRVAVVLQHDRSGAAGVSAEPGDRVVERNFDVLVDRYAVLKDADLGRLNLLTVLEHRRPEVDVVALPDCWRLARVDLGCRDLVNSTAVVVLTL